MTTRDIGRPFQGDVWYYPEASYGDGGLLGTSYTPSDKVMDVRIDTGDMHKTLRGISSVSVCAFISQPSNPVLHVEWVLQDKDATQGSLATFCVERPDDALRSLVFVVGANTKEEQPSYWKLSGCKCKTFNKSSSFGNEYVCTADFSVQSVATATTAYGTKPSAVGGRYAIFNNAGGIYQNSTEALAFITNSIDYTVENNITDYWDSDSLTKVAAIEGGLDVTGSCDISCDGGGAGLWGVVFGGSELTNITIDTGTTGVNDLFTLNTVHFDSTGIDINTSNDGMMSSVPFTAKWVSIA